MAFDAFFLAAVLDELRQKTAGARVEKIHQPARDTVILHLRCEAGREKLLFVANPTAPRLHLTAENPENPDQPPMFCMLLRKHLSGARLTAITQPPMERMARFTFDCIDEMGDPVQKHLVVELMGRTCNLYLLDPEERILDCLRRVGLDETSHRPALPGLKYQLPAPVEKQDPRTLALEDYVNLINAPGADELSDRLMDTLGGLSPLVCREAALYAAGDMDARLADRAPETLAKGLWEFFQNALTAPQPSYFAQGGIPKQYAFCPLAQYGAYAQAESFCALLDLFYTVKGREEAMRQKSQAVRKTVSNLCQRLKRKIAIQENFTRIQMEVRSIIMSECGTTQQIAPVADTGSADASDEKDATEPEKSLEERKEKFVNDAFDDD